MKYFFGDLTTVGATLFILTVAGQEAVCETVLNCTTMDEH
jgi:hypothetical protein